MDVNYAMQTNRNFKHKKSESLNKINKLQTGCLHYQKQLIYKLC